MESNQGANSATLKSKKIKIKNIDREPGKPNLESRIEYLNKLPDLPRSQENSMEPKDLDSMKFFAPENPRKLKHTRSFSNKSIIKASEGGNHDYPSSPGMPHTNSIFKDFVKNKKLALVANEVGDSIQARSLTASPNSLKVSNSDRIRQVPSPLIGVSTVNFHTAQRISTATSFKRPQTQSPLTAGLGLEKEMDYIPLNDKVYSNSGPNSPCGTPVSGGRLRTGLDIDKTMRPSHFKDNTKSPQFFVTTSQGKDDEFEFEGMEQKATEDGKFVKLANINMGGLFSGTKSVKSSHGSRLQSSQAWRKKVFTKTHQRMGSADLPAVKLAMVSTPITTINNRK